MASKNLKGYEGKSAITAQLKTAEDTVAWTPPEKLVKAVINDFLDRVEPKWLEATIRRDPALYKHMDVSDEDLKAFLGSRESAPTLTLKDLTTQKKISQETLDEITNEVKTYQGLHAIAFHKVAHALYNRAMEEKQSGNRTEAAKDLLLARQISQGVRRLTAGIEIHPGADIGKNFFIDHGASVVIGETCNIGNDVFLYHGVTLGASSGQELQENKPIPRRHPTIGDGTIISTGVNILGPVTIGKKVKIGADALITGNVKKDETGKVIGNLMIANEVSILPRVEVTQDIQKEKAIVVGSLPNIPGYIDFDPNNPTTCNAGKPILQPRRSEQKTKPDTSVLPLREWFGHLVEHVKKIGMPQ